MCFCYVLLLLFCIPFNLAHMFERYLCFVCTFCSEEYRFAVYGGISVLLVDVAMRHIYPNTSIYAKKFFTEKREYDNESVTLYASPSLSLCFWNPKPYTHLILMMCFFHSGERPGVFSCVASSFRMHDLMRLAESEQLIEWAVALFSLCANFIYKHTYAHTYHLGSSIHNVFFAFLLCLVFPDIKYAMGWIFKGRDREKGGCKKHMVGSKNEWKRLLRTEFY